MVRALGGEVVTAEVMHFLRAAAERRAISVNAVPIRDSAGTIVAAVATYYDITEQTRLEQAMHTARAEAETANRAKDEFLAILGHELRNP
ncbi:MAG: PAS domain-containing protein, partial [Polyangia bacterium]